MVLTARGKLPLTLLTLVIAAACTRGDARDGGETHWLRVCEEDDDCPSGECWCGLCTLGCEGDRACDGSEATSQCFEMASPGLTGRCSIPAPAASTGVCLPLCTDSLDCAGDWECFQGACVPPFGSDNDSDGAGASGGNRPRASDFADVEVEQDFTEPVWLPPPDTRIEGATEEWVGSWVQLTSEDRPCTPDDVGAGMACLHIEIRKEGEGRFTGVLFGNVPSQPWPNPNGPFPAAVDPNVGYPTTLAPEEYSKLLEYTAGVEYRIFDGFIEGDLFTFWVSPVDVWDDWCGLQEPFAWEIDGRREYRCVPQLTELSDVDLGWFELCTQASDLDVCPLPGGPPELGTPCLCTDEGGLPCATPAVCECSQNTCRADVRPRPVSAQFERTRDLLSGYSPFSGGLHPTEILSFRRVTR